MEDKIAKRKAYYRQYYKDHVNLEQERKRKQEFYERNKEQILAKAKERYQRKKAQKNEQATPPEVVEQEVTSSE